MSYQKVGYAFTGSFCTIAKSIEELEKLSKTGAEITPIFSETVYQNSTRFYEKQALIEKVESICKKPIIHSVVAAEPIGPKKLFDVLIICPCTGNTLAKLANGITDTAVTMAAKAHLRNERPILLCVASNDALRGSAENIGKLLNRKNIYFVPMAQDDSKEKPASIVADFNQLLPALNSTEIGRQLQPILKI